MRWCTYISDKHPGFIKIITIKANGSKVIDIDEASVETILNIYPDESLIDRPVFTDALRTGELSFSKLHTECETLMIPWQLFLLEPQKLEKAIEKIDAKRKAKFDKKLLANRANGDKSGISLRIADRLIAFQEFAREQVSDKNIFCGSLKNIHHSKWAEAVINYFEIDTMILSGGNKSKALESLITCVETKNIRVARGVLDSTNRLLPVAKTVRQIYRKSSGFVIEDCKVPYIFLPNELNDSETSGRQILTLITLLILIGNNQYDMVLSGQLELLVDHHTKKLRQAFAVATEILLPFSATDMYKGLPIDTEVIEMLSSKYMLTPTAVIVTLSQRGLVVDAIHKQELLNATRKSLLTGDTKTYKRSANIDNAVKKWCGNATTTDIVDAIRSKSLSSIQAQYLIFGRVDKLRYAKFKASFGI